jgi:hypothetical protein
MRKMQTGTRVPDSLPVQVSGSEIPETPILKVTQNWLKVEGAVC